MLMSQSVSKIAPLLVQAQSEMGNAVKDSNNPFFKSKYADLNAVREASIPVLNKLGISVLQPTVVLDGKKYVQTTLLHSSGEFVASLTEILLSKENDAQQQGSGISYARRYGLQSLLNIGAEDDDGEKAVGRFNKEAAVPSPAKTAPAASKPIVNSSTRPATADAKLDAPAAAQANGKSTDFSNRGRQLRRPNDGQQANGQQPSAGAAPQRNENF